MPELTTAAPACPRLSPPPPGRWLTPAASRRLSAYPRCGRRSRPPAGSTRKRASSSDRRLLVTHAAVGVVTGLLTAVNAIGIPVFPTDVGLGRWSVGLPLLAFGQSVAGCLFRCRPTPRCSPTGSELTHFVGFALLGGTTRFLALVTPAVASADPRYHDLLYRFDAVLTNYPFIFAIILYGVLIPNTRRRSLIGVGVLCVVPLAGDRAGRGGRTRASDRRSWRSSR